MTQPASWLGEIPANWSVKRLKYVSSINDEALPETTDPEYELLYVDIGSVDATEGIQKKEPIIFENAPSRARRIVRDGDTIVSTVRTYLRAVAPIEQPEENLVVSTGFAVVRPRGAAPKFLAHCLRSSYFIETVVSRSVGVSYPATNPTDVSCIEVPLPPLEEQQAIVRFLDAKTAQIDTLVAKKRQLIDKLKEKRSALIARTVTRGLPPEAAKAAGLEPNPEMKDSGVEWLGTIPSHWAVKRLRHIGEAVIGLTYEPGDVSDEEDGTLVLRSSNVQAGKITLDDNVYVKKAIPKHLRTRAGDILICSRNGSRALIGKNAKIDRRSEGMTFGAFMTVFRSEMSEYLYWVFNSDLFTFQSGAFLTSTINQLTVNNLYSFAIALPPADEQRHICAYLEKEVSALDLLISKVETAISRLTEYRQALITSAVTGKIDVRNCQAEKEAA
ncbi:MAG: restriction endonuclease subunit S [Pseudomonadota bacterium]